MHQPPSGSLGEDHYRGTGEGHRGHSGGTGDGQKEHYGGTSEVQQVAEDCGMTPERGEDLLVMISQSIYMYEHKCYRF